MIRVRAISRRPPLRFRRRYHRRLPRLPGPQLLPRYDCRSVPPRHCHGSNNAVRSRRRGRCNTAQDDRSEIGRSRPCPAAHVDANSIRRRSGNSPRSIAARTGTRIGVPGHRTCTPVICSVRVAAIADNLVRNNLRRAPAERHTIAVRLVWGAAPLAAATLLLHFAWRNCATGDRMTACERMLSPDASWTRARWKIAW